jgi:hypothetical protein
MAKIVLHALVICSGRHAEVTSCMVDLYNVPFASECQMTSILRVRSIVITEIQHHKPAKCSLAFLPPNLLLAALMTRGAVGMVAAAV